MTGLDFNNPDASVLESCLPANGARSMDIGPQEATKDSQRSQWFRFVDRTSYWIRSKVPQ